MLGSRSTSWKGRQSASIAIARGVILAWSISDCDLRLGLPVRARRRAARRRRMVEDDVSGRRKKRDRKTGPFIQSISHWLQCQFFAVTLKPEMMGPSAGPQVAAKAHSEST